MTFNTLQLAIEDRIAVVTLNRPPVEEGRKRYHRNTCETEETQHTPS